MFVSMKMNLQSRSTYCICKNICLFVRSCFIFCSCSSKTLPDAAARPSFNFSARRITDQHWDKNGIHICIAYKSFYFLLKTSNYMTISSLISAPCGHCPSIYKNILEGNILYFLMLQLYTNSGIARMVSLSTTLEITLQLKIHVLLASLKQTECIIGLKSIE